MAASQAAQRQEAHDRLATIGDAEFEAEIKLLRLDRKTVAEERARETHPVVRLLSIPSPGPTLGHHRDMASEKTDDRARGSDLAGRGANGGDCSSNHFGRNGRSAAHRFKPGGRILHSFLLCAC